VTNNADGLMTVSTGDKLFVTYGLATNDGIINLTGGTFDNNSQTLTNNAQISGYGILRTGGLTNSGTVTLSGGVTTVTGDVTNQTAGELTIAYDPALFTGAVVNDGTVKTTDTTVTWAGSFTNNGGYISDPSTQYFTDLTVGASGYLVGSSQDTFIVSNNYVNESTQKTLWDTAAATLQFVTNDSLHDLHLAGTDLGATFDGYEDNFAWGTLNIDGQTIYLYDGNEIDGGALYVGEILGVETSGLQVTNIIMGLEDPELSIYYDLNIYYNPFLADNDYLGGLTYDLTNAGQLIPTPVPGSVLLLGTGLLGLGLLGWRRKRG
jgi:hypothetical protein